MILAPWKNAIGVHVWMRYVLMSGTVEEVADVVVEEDEEGVVQMMVEHPVEGIAVGVAAVAG